MRQTIALVSFLAEHGGSLSLILYHEGSCKECWARCRAAVGPSCEQGWRGPAAALRNLLGPSSVLQLLAVITDVVVLWSVWRD